ncbi:hypothetical protein WDW86_13720 [Bdellovibrionota bacterium FG-2]
MSRSVAFSGLRYGYMRGHWMTFRSYDCKKLIFVLGFSSVAWSVGGCGQNPHLIGATELNSFLPSPRPEQAQPPVGDGAEAGFKTDDCALTSSCPVPSVTPAPEVSPLPSPLPEASPSVSPIAVTSPTPTVTCPSSPVAPVPTSQVIVITSQARPLSAQETSSVILPYRSMGTQKVKVAQIREGAPLAGGAAADWKWVKDTQVLFAFDFDLPSRADVIEPENAAAKFQLNFVKYTAETNPYSPTEIFCLLDPKVCSGVLYFGAWEKNRNPAFWGYSGQLLSRMFSDVVLSSLIPLPGDSQHHLYYGNAVPLEWQDVFAGKKVVDVLYSGQVEPDRASLRKTLRLVLADDTYLSAATLSITLKVRAGAVVSGAQVLPEVIP